MGYGGLSGRREGQEMRAKGFRPLELPLPWRGWKWGLLAPLGPGWAEVRPACLMSWSMIPDASMIWKCVVGQLGALGALCGVTGHEVWPLNCERLSGASGMSLELVMEGKTCDSPLVIGSHWPTDETSVHLRGFWGLWIQPGLKSEH